MKYLLSPFHSNVPSFLPHVTPFTFFYLLPSLPPSCMHTLYLLSPSCITLYLLYPLPSATLMHAHPFFLPHVPPFTFYLPQIMYLLSPPHVSPFTFYLTLMYHPLPSISFHPPSCITLYLLSPSTHTHVSPFTFYLLPPTLMYHPLP